MAWYPAHVTTEELLKTLLDHAGDAILVVSDAIYSRINEFYLEKQPGKILIIRSDLTSALLNNIYAREYKSIGLIGFDVDIDTINVIIASQPRLTGLNLSGNTIGEGGARAIAEHLTGLTQLDLAANNIGGGGARAIAEHLTGLTQLGLSDNEIGEGGARAIAEHLTGLTQLDLSDNNIGDGGTRAIAEHLTGLTQLDLSDNNIGDGGTRAIAEHLAGLTQLDLSDNNIGGGGARAIAEHLTGLTRLQLRRNAIGEGGALAIAEHLTGLTRLDLYDNKIGEGGARAIAEHLTGLTQLDLSDNNIGDGGTRAIAEHLTGLTQLDLYFNNIGEGGALAIAEHLTGLTQLDLSDNNIGEGGARAIAEHLTGLTRLQLRRNAIGEGGAQAIAEHLTRLTQLDLHDNGIGEGGGRSLLAAFLGRRLRILYLGDNPLTQTLLTPESFQTRDALTILAAWKAHTEAADSGRLQPLDEAKMLVLGDEAVGKTSLVRFITKGLPRDPDERATRGARLYDRITTDGWTPASTGVRLNVWDFGGQEIQHGTHRYFLTRRSLYLVVLEDRREDKGAARATKWLRVIESVAGEDAPVVLVVNKCDGPPQLTFDQDGLMRDFPQLKKVLRVSCNDDARSRESIAKLKEVIASLLTSGAMPHLSDQLPAEWLEVRNAIADMAEKTPVLDQDAYRALCTDDTVTKGREITDADEQRSLLRLLHDLGTVIAHGLERDAAVALSSVRLLDPNWLTTAIYTVLERIKVEDRAGEFSRSDLIDWLHPKLYPEEKHEFIIAMMRDPALELCFRLPSNEERFLAPEGLRENSPDYSQFTKEALRFRYRYAEVPRGLIPRLIVKLHDYLERPPQIWLTGGRFHIGGAMVIVEGDRIDRQIDISVLDEQRRAALFTLRQTMQNLHDNYREIGATAVVPMPDDPEIEERYDYLQQLEEEEGPDYRHRPSGAKRSYAVAELLDSIDEPRRVVRETVPPTHTAPPEREENQRPSQPRQTLLSLAILFPVGAAIFSFLGALRFGLDGFWSALLAFISFVCANFILRLFDRAFVFRRLLIAWVGSGLTLVAIGGIAAQLNIEGFSFDYGGAPTWTVAVIWAIGLLFLVVVAHFEAKREEARSMDRA